MKPIVQIGHAGLTPQVLSAIDVALTTHELIKVKLTGESEASARDLIEAIESGTKSSVAQVIGHTLVIYRPRDDDPRLVLPRGKPDAGDDEE